MMDKIRSYENKGVGSKEEGIKDLKNKQRKNHCKRIYTLAFIIILVSRQD